MRALLDLQGDDCVLPPSGPIRLSLHEKGKAQRREVELSPKATRLVRRYMFEYNACAAACGWSTRIGGKGSFWRGPRGRRWSYDGVRATLHSACTAKHMARLTPHSFRRAFATHAASHLPRHVVARAGGWQGLDRFDNHYVHPHADTIIRKIAEMSSSAQLDEPMQEEVDSAKLQSVTSI